MFGSASSKPMNLDEAVGILNKLRAEKERERQAWEYVGTLIESLNDLKTKEASLNKRKKEIASLLDDAEREYDLKIEKFNAKAADAAASAAAKIEAANHAKEASIQLGKEQVERAEQKYQARLEELDRLTLEAKRKYEESLQQYQSKSLEYDQRLSTRQAEIDLATEKLDALNHQIKTILTSFNSV